MIPRTKPSLELLESRLVLSLSTSSLLEGPTSGSDSVLLSAGGAWTATSNSSWITLNNNSQSGSGNALVAFSFAANTGTTRQGTLTIDGLTLTVTQAGSTYQAANPVETVVSSGLQNPFGVAVDASGNVYIADYNHNAIKEWVASTQTVQTLVFSGLNNPRGVAVDASGNVYIADFGNSAIKEWVASTQTVQTLVSSGLQYPKGVAVDASGNVYIADTYDSAIKEWVASTQTVQTLVSSGLNYPEGVAVDASGNVYIADTSNSAIKEWVASTQTVQTLVSSGLQYPESVAVDASGNVYIADFGNGAIKEWEASTQTVQTLVSLGLIYPFGVAVDASGNVYIADTYNSAIKEQVRAFVDSTTISISDAAGSGGIGPVILPATQSLAGIYAPTSDQSWLTLGIPAHGVIPYSFSANTTGAARTAHINVLGVLILVTQARLSTSSLLEGPTSGSDSVLLSAGGAWTATSNSPWITVNSNSQSGSGNALVAFSFAANTGTTRQGTLTIDGLTLTITQAGSTYQAANSVETLVSSGLYSPTGVAVDASGNVYIADNNHNAIKEWVASTQTVKTLVSSGLNFPFGVAVDASGNVYIADSGNNAIKEWVASTQTVQTLVSSGLYNPSGVAVDASGNVYIADNGNNAIKEWVASTQTVKTLVSSGLYYPSGVAVDASGNVYIADSSNYAIKEWLASTQTVLTLFSSGLSYPEGVAVDASGNVYIADYGYSTNTIKEWVASTQTVQTLVSSGLYHPSGVAVDASGNVYIADSSNNAIKEQVRAFVDSTTISISGASGSGQLPVILPATQSLTGIYAPSSDQSWLTLGIPAHGVIPYSFSANLTGAVRTAHINVLGVSIPVTQAPRLSTSSLLEGPTSGSDSVLLSAGGAWTATSNSPWITVNSNSQSGSGNALVAFSFAANTGTTRQGTLTIDGLTLTVTQAGSTYQAANPVETLVSSGLNLPFGVAVDASSNVYIADSLDNAIKEWVASTQTAQTLVSSGLFNPEGVAVDASGNVYIADTFNNAIKEWVASTQTVKTLVSSGLSYPTGVAVDASGNVYIADSRDNAIKEWVASTQTVQTLVSSGLFSPRGVAVDASGNVYIADTSNSAIKEWLASTQTVQTLVSSGLQYPYGVAVDASGNVYIAENINSAIKEWLASTQTVKTLVSSGLNNPEGVAVDASGNVYIADLGNNAIKEQVRAFVDSTTISISGASGSGQLPVILPSSQSLAGIYAPSSDQSWLTLGMPANGVIPYSFSANSTEAARTAHINVLGVSIPVTQAGLSTSSLLEGPTSGSDSVLLSAGGAWTATSNSSWITLNNNSQSGSGNALVAFSFAANTGTTRQGTLTIDGLTLTVTQAGSTYQAANSVETLVSSGLYFPTGVAVDASGNVYIADNNHNAIKEWVASTQTVKTLVSSGLNFPFGVAVDASGNVYIADNNHNAIKEWVASTQTVQTLVSSGLYFPTGVAVDASGNVYIADNGNNAIKEWLASTQTVKTLVSSGLYLPSGVAVDASGNVYIADSSNYAIKEWLASTQTVQTLVSSGLQYPSGVAVDASGNVYIADYGYSTNTIKEWVASTQTVKTLVSSGLINPTGVAVDASGNVYIADVVNSAIKEQVRAFVDSTTISLSGASGSGQLPVILPSTQSLAGIYAPSSDQSWLTLGMPANGVIPYSFSANLTGAARTAHLNVLGVSIPVTQVTAAASQVVITTAPTSGTAGSPLSPLVVKIEDPYGNVVTSSSAAVSVTASIGSITVGSTTTVAAVNGVATFTNLTLNIAGNTTLTVASSGLTSAKTSIVINKISPTLTAIASPTVTLGTATVTLSDQAALSGGLNPTGKITFVLALNNNPVYTTQVPVNGNGTYKASYTLPKTGAVAGTYSWKANYSGDGNNSQASSSEGSTNQTIVNKAQPTVVAKANHGPIYGIQGQTLSASAILSGGYTPSGSLQFTLKANGIVVYTTSVTVTANGNYSVNYQLPHSISTKQTYIWSVSYLGDANNLNASNQSDVDGQVTVLPYPPSLRPLIRRH